MPLAGKMWNLREETPSVNSYERTLEIEFNSIWDWMRTASPAPGRRRP